MGGVGCGVWQSSPRDVADNSTKSKLIGAPRKSIMERIRLNCTAHPARAASASMIAQNASDARSDSQRFWLNAASRRLSSADPSEVSYSVREDARAASPAAIALSCRFIDVTTAGSQASIAAT